VLSPKRAASVGQGTDSARLGATAEVTAPDNGATAAPASSTGRQVELGDTSPPAEQSATRPQHDPEGYVPMAPAAGEQRAEVARADPVQRTPAAAPTPVRVAPPQPDQPVDRRKLEGRVREGVEECYRIVRSKDLERLAKLYAPRTVADEEKLRRLTRILRTEPWQAVVGRRVDGVREVGSRGASAEFSFRLTWRDSYGGRLSSQPIFRAEFGWDGEDWAMSSCRIVGSPKL
jgi:hypothetical protein